MATKAAIKHDPIKFTLADIPMPEPQTRGPKESPLAAAMREMTVGGPALVVENPDAGTGARLYRVAKRLGIKLVVRQLDGGRVGAWRVAASAEPAAAEPTQPAA